MVNLVPTTDAAAVVENWLSDDRVRKVSFTGSTGVGRVLLKQAADRIVNASMELGGNAPFVVTADADVEAAIAGAMVAKFRGGGQACTAANRFYVHASVVDEFVAGLGAEVAALRVGPASDPASQVGPLVSERAAAASGGRDRCRGSRRCRDRRAGPDAGRGVVRRADALLTGVAPDAAILADEIFGPVAPVVVWER